MVNTPVLPKSYQFWNNIAATPPDFMLDAGNYGMTIHATSGWAGVVLRRLLADSVTYVSVMGSAALAADGYLTFTLPAGQYQLTLTTVVGLIGMIEKIDVGRR